MSYYQEQANAALHLGMLVAPNAQVQARLRDLYNTTTLNRSYYEATVALVDVIEEGVKYNSWPK